MSNKAPRIGVIAAAILAIALVGCSSSTAPGESSTSVSSRSATSAPPAASASPAPSPSIPDDATTVDINIAGGVVTPTNGQAQGVVGKPIVLKVSSDVADQLHVHSSPENTFQVEPRRDQVFEFTVDVPGQVDIELHDLNRTVVTVQVRP
ncbi:hypothetical protein [Mycolicibacterium arseniciresistens]|uniref:Lipoprotein LpqE n=1 Tax=Mycolicibacterium arseniciresistens TaxID=3062257 RepID=A0ABT8UA89_9MYCO|nr:hypothetical protein [Mycolicibacterium arseniciresistens]